MLLSGVGEGVNSEWVLSGLRVMRMPLHFRARYVASLIRDGSESYRGVNSEWVSSGWRVMRIPQHFQVRYVASLIRDGSESNRGGGG
jgi:hypothetical protein